VLGGIMDVNDDAKIMNSNPEIGSTWKGRILMQIEAHDAKHPERDVRELEKTIKETAINLKCFKPRPYTIILEVGMGICLPPKTSGGLLTSASPFKIRVKIGDAFDWTSGNPKEDKGTYSRWSERYNQQTIQTIYQSVEEMDKVFVYLMEGDSPICYWKGGVTEFTDPDPKFRWIHMKADKAVGTVKKDYEAGMIQFKMSITDETKNGGPIDYKTKNSWKGQPLKRLESRLIRCFIFQCRDIPAADSDGQSDSYISLWNPDGKNDIKTKVIEDSLNPIYFETLEMVYDMADIENSPPIVVNIWDKDEGLLNDSFDFLGRSTIFLHEASTNPLENSGKKSKADIDVCNQVPKPKWHDIRMGFDENLPPCGQVLCSFVVVQTDFEFKTPLKQHRLGNIIPMKEYNIEINVLGLRDLESFGLMPIRKPYIRFRIKSLLPPEKAQAVTNVDTDPNANGPNPNINTTLTFSIQLPEDEIYCPTLACDIFDFVFSGLSQPLIGTMQIPIGVMKTASKKKRLDEKAEMDAIIIELEKQNSLDEK
jgi:hypothetical protein